MNKPARKSTNLSLDAKLVAQAKDLDINISRVAERSIADAVAQERAKLWKIENRDEIAYWNQHFEENGLPFEEFRQF